MNPEIGTRGKTRIARGERKRLRIDIGESFSGANAVSDGQAIATSTSLLGSGVEVLRSPLQGIVMGMTTMPAVGPGDAVAHIAVPASDTAHLKMENSIERLETDTIENQLREHLATNFAVSVLEERIS